MQPAIRSGLASLLLICCVAAIAAADTKIRKDKAKTNSFNIASSSSTASSSQSSNQTLGIPIAIIYDRNTSAEIQKLVSRAIHTINGGIKYGRNKWLFHFVTIEISDSHELMQAVCAQLAKGVLAIFGPTHLSSLDVLNSITNFYHVPYISWTFLDRYIEPSGMRRQREGYKILVKRQIIRSRQQNHEDNKDEAEYEMSEDEYYENQGIIAQSSEYPDSGESEDSAYQLYLRPDLTPALISIINFYEWPRVYYIYNYQQAVANMEKLLEYQNSDPAFLQRILIRRVSDIHNCRDMLRAIEASNENSVNNREKITMMVDLDSKESYMAFLNQIKDLGMTKVKYYYVLATLGIYELDVNDFRHGGAHIIGFAAVDYYNVNTLRQLSEVLQTGEPLNRVASDIPSDAALLIDGLVFFSRVIGPLLGANTSSSLFGMEAVAVRRGEIYVNRTRGVECAFNLEAARKWPLGKFVLEHLKEDNKLQQQQQPHEGLTGPVSFDSTGRRRRFNLGVYKVSLNRPLKRIGYYYADKGLRIAEERRQAEERELEEAAKVRAKVNRKLVVVTIIDDPFVMHRPAETGKNFTGNDRYIGYCVDLTRRIAEIVNFTYELRLVADKKFGSRDANGNWDGMVGELVRHEADMAVAPLTISAQRERAIEFSMPFMNIGISIMIKKPKKEKPGVFSFMAPLDSRIWVCVILAYTGVSIILFLVSHFSPYEWHYDAKKDERGLVNDFTVLNTLWFNLAALMQQGVDIAPRAVSGRLAASAWWFFTLILISSYTANLAAFLTVERMVSPIESAEQLSRQTEIQYGALEGGSTKEFFRNSKVDTYQRMWNFMSSWGPSVFVKTNAEGVNKVRTSGGKYAYLLESSLNEYLNERDQCDTMKVGGDLDSKGYGIATPIRSELRDPINLAVLQLREEGFLDELKTKWWYDRSECGNSGGGGGKDSSQSALNLINVAGIFYILIVGLIVAVMVAVCELMYKAKLQAKRNKIEFKEAVKSKMRLSISGYEDSLKEFRQRKNIGDSGSNQITAFPNLEMN